MPYEKKRSGRNLESASPREVASIQVAGIVGFFTDGVHDVIEAVDDSELSDTPANDEDVEPIFVGDFTQLCLYCNYVKAGSTRVAVQLKVSYKEDGPYFPVPYTSPPAGGAVKLNDMIYRRDDNGPFPIPQPNFGFQWLKVFVYGQGNLAGASCEVHVARGWGN